MTPEECIQRIRILPDLRLAAHGVTIHPTYSEPDKAIIFALRVEYEAIADWLQFYWQNELHQFTLLTNTIRLDFKKHADRIVSFREFAKQLVLTPSWIDKCTDPVAITFNCAAEICENQLFNSGFFSSKASQIGSRKNYKDATEYYKYLVDLKRCDFVDNESFLSPIKALETCGAYEASINKDFKEDHYKPYLREQKSYHRNLDRSDLLVLRLHHGEPEFSSRGVAPGRPRKVQEGE